MKKVKSKIKKKLTKTQSRYKFKPGHATKVKARSLKDYRKSKGDTFELTGSVVLRSLGFLDDEAENIFVVNTVTGNKERMPIIRLTRLAELMDTSYQTIWRWSSKGDQLPSPILADNTEGRGRMVYHVEEARIMVGLIGEHLRQFKYYRKDHTGVKDRLFSEIETLRNLNYGVANNGTKISRKKTSKVKRRRSS